METGPKHCPVFHGSVPNPAEPQGHPTPSLFQIVTPKPSWNPCPAPGTWEGSPVLPFSLHPCGPWPLLLHFTANIPADSCLGLPQGVCRESLLGFAFIPHLGMGPGALWAQLGEGGSSTLDSLSLAPAQQRTPRAGESGAGGSCPSPPCSLLGICPQLAPLNEELRAAISLFCSPEYS